MHRIGLRTQLYVIYIFLFRHRTHNMAIHMHGSRPNVDDSDRTAFFCKLFFNFCANGARTKSYQAQSKTDKNTNAYKPYRKLLRVIVLYHHRIVAHKPFTRKAERLVFFYFLSGTPRGTFFSSNFTLPTVLTLYQQPKMTLKAGFLIWG